MMLTAKTTTEQAGIPENPQLIWMSSFLQNQGFSGKVANRIAASQRLSCRVIYTSKWAVLQ